MRDHLGTPGATRRGSDTEAMDSVKFGPQLARGMMCISGRAIQLIPVWNKNIKVIYSAVATAKFWSQTHPFTKWSSY